MTKDCRAAAARCLASVVHGKSLARQLPLYQQQIPAKDHALLSQLCYGTLRIYPKLLAIGEQLLQRPLKNKDQDIHMLLLLGGYQLMETRIPDHAAVDATVKACVALKKPWAKNLVNGVLRQWQRRQDKLLSHLSDAALASHPGWLYDTIKTAWPAQSETVFAANNQQPPLCLRVNLARISRDAYLQQLQDAGFAASKTDHADSGIRLEQAVGVDALPGFNEGLVSIQDESAQLAAGLLAPEPGMRILDACAAPGGKTCHLLEHQPEVGEVVAIDRDPERLDKIRQNLVRLRLNATTLAADAGDPARWWDGQPFDHILLDAPCSATGVIRRNPDIKVLRTAEQIDGFARQQLRLLSSLWPCLKPGGWLLYSTCSILPTENQEVINTFLNNAEDAIEYPFAADWGIACRNGRQILPAPNGPDGFYYARLRKVE
jgi:16S rRNA (cytosine967-C5)-methyltransferase